MTVQKEIKILLDVGKINNPELEPYVFLHQHMAGSYTPELLKHNKRFSFVVSIPVEVENPEEKLHLDGVAIQAAPEN